MQNKRVKYLGSPSETIATLTNGDVEDELLHLDFPHGVRQFLLWSLFSVHFSSEPNTRKANKGLNSRENKAIEWQKNTEAEAYHWKWNPKRSCRVSQRHRSSGVEGRRQIYTRCLMWWLGFWCTVTIIPLLKICDFFNVNIK